jgi:hypothetical protein
MRAGSVSLKFFQACLRQGPLSLRHVQVNLKITVVDHSEAEDPGTDHVLFGLDGTIFLRFHICQVTYLSKLGL